MKDSETEQRLRDEAKTLLEEGKVSCIIGFEPGSLKFTTTPLITRDKDSVVAKDRDELDDITGDGDKVVITVGAEQQQFPAAEVLFDNCLACPFPVPQEYDILLDKPASPAADETASRQGMATLAGMPREQRWDFWAKEFSRCIKCYACRSVCPACFCERCFVEESEPQWIAPIPRWQDNLMFQAIRNIHLAGRCTDCGECERACPVGIPLRSLTKEMDDIVDGLYQFKAGIDKEAAPLMTHYEATDPDGFIR